MHRIRLGNTVFEGLNNAYLFPDEPTTLVDTGVATSEVRAEFTEALAEAALTLADIDRVFLTHYHPDHSGLAAAIQEAGGASVHIHETDAPMVRREDEALATFEKRQLTCYEQWDMPADKRKELDAYIHDRVENLYGMPTTVSPITDGDRFEIGPYSVEVLHTPGHTEGQCCFVDREYGIVFTGDTLLPHYTPNIGGADVRMKDSLKKYLASLQRLINEDLGRALPGHRDPITNPTERAKEIVHHHENRARRIVAYLGEFGPATTWEVSDYLFGELVDIHILHGPGEAHAHLEHLYNTGEIEEAANGYKLTSETAARLRENSGERWPLKTNN